MIQIPPSSSGEMENSAADQLPEVDSLPDGFVESSVEPSVPRTPTFEQEKRSVNYKDSLLEFDRSGDTIHDFSSSLESSSASETRAAEGIVEKTEKQRTFPVPLSEKDGFDESGDSVELGHESLTGSTEAGSLTMPEPGSAISETSASLPSYNAPMMGSSCGDEHDEGDRQISDSTTEGNSEPLTTNLKDKSPLESTESSQYKKLETSEVKRKNVKRSFKSEKEFLEFTLKYQQVIAERDAAIAVRDKLESLCRELQRQNKILMDECKRVSAEGQTMRLDLSTKFHDAINDVSIKLEEQKDEYLSQLKENEMLRNKLKHLADQYTLSEQQFTQKLKQKSLELQLADLKIQQHEEKLIQEKSQMQSYAEQVSQLLATEKKLRLQLATDGEKFQQFQDALLKSNEVFETFKQEIEKMAKSIKDLKKENVFLKRKCEKSDVALVELVEEREYLKKQLEKTKNQKEKLESLCRSLQAERKQNSFSGNSVSNGPKIVSPASVKEEKNQNSVFIGPEMVSTASVEEEKNQNSFEGNPIPK